MLRFFLMIPLLVLILGGAIRAAQNNFAGIPGRVAGSLMVLLFYSIWLLTAGSATDILACTLIGYGGSIAIWAWSWNTEKEEHIEWDPSNLIGTQPPHHSDASTVVSLSEEDRQLLRDVRAEIFRADDD